MPHSNIAGMTKFSKALYYEGLAHRESDPKKREGYRDIARAFRDANEYDNARREREDLGLTGDGI